jgi:hypothetical protein
MREKSNIIYSFLHSLIGSKCNIYKWVQNIIRVFKVRKNMCNIDILMRSTSQFMRFWNLVVV